MAPRLATGQPMPTMSNPRSPRTVFLSSTKDCAYGSDASVPSSSPLYQEKTSVRFVGTFASDFASARSMFVPLPLSYEPKIVWGTLS